MPSSTIGKKAKELFLDPQSGFCYESTFRQRLLPRCRAGLCSSRQALPTISSSSVPVWPSVFWRGREVLVHPPNRFFGQEAEQPPTTPQQAYGICIFGSLQLHCELA